MKHWSVIGMLLLCLAAMSTAVAKQSVTLARDGKATATIVVEKNASRVAQFAALELQEHLLKITGAQLPILNDDLPVTGVRILVGESAATRALGLKSDNFKTQEYLIRFAKDTLILMGCDRLDDRLEQFDRKAALPSVFDAQGSCYAVYDFLERYCGVRWYAPGDFGLVCPARATLTVAGNDTRRSPAFPFRHGSYVNIYGLLQGSWNNPTGADVQLFMRRMRFGGQPYAANHSFYGYYDRFWEKNPANPGVFEASHKDWFAQGFEGKPPQMCFTNPGFIQQVVQDARDYFDGKGKKPGAFAEGDFYSLVPMDAGEFCKCPVCQAQMHKDEAAGGWNGYGSDYIFNFVNTVAKEVKKTHPDKYIACLAYSDYLFYPRHTQLESNIAVQLCLNTRMWPSPGTEATDMQVYRSWVGKEKDRPIYLWLYYTFPEEYAMNGGYHCFPGFFAHTIDRQFKMFAKDHIRGAFLNNLGDYFDAYITYKYLDNPQRNIDKELDEFFTGFYGHAAAPMKALYLDIEKIYTDPRNYPAPGVKADGAEIAWKYQGTEARMAQLGALMAQAKAAAQTEMEKQRVTAFEQAYWNYMVEGRKQYVDRLNAPVPVQTAPRVPEAGGDAAKVAWTQAAPLAAGWFDRGWNTPTPRKLAGRIAHDGAFLYLELTDPCDTTKLVASAQVFAYDTWEIFTTTTPERKISYRQFASGPSGLLVPFCHGEEKGVMNVKIENSGVRVVADTTAPDRWVQRVAIPLSSVARGGVLPGEKVYLNIIRVTSPTIAARPDGRFGIDSWVAYTTVHDTSRLAEITLAK